MKKIIFLLSASTFLAACANTNDITAARGANSSTLSQAELDQYNKQRANEVIESQAQAEKARGYADVIHSGSSAIQSGMGAIQSIRNTFGF